VSIGFDYQDGQPRSVTWGSFPMFFSDGTRTDWSRSVTTATDWSYWNRRTQTVFGELRHEFDSGWTLHGTLSHRRFTEQTNLFYVAGFVDPTDGSGLDPFAYRSRNRISENSLDVYATGPFQLLGRKHELVLGYNGSRAHNVGSENATVGTLAPVGNFFAWDGSYAQPDFAPDSPLSDIETKQDAVYAAARISLTDSLKLITGARWARWKVDSFYVYDDPVNSAYNFSKVIPYAGAIWDFSKAFSLFTSYTGIFKPQNARDIGGHYLDPITGRSAEIGIKGEHFDKQLNTSFTVFDTRQRNIAAPALDGSGAAVLLPDGSAASVAVPGTRTRGFEAEASGRLTPEWQGSIGWTRNITKDSDTGETIRTFIPATLVRLFTTWNPRQLDHRLTLGSGLNWQSASSTTIASPSGPAVLRQASVTLVSLMARYQFTPNLSLQLNANNVLDRKYFVLDQYDNTYYGAPASYSMTLRVAY
jgi:outer membrane receptor for ferric coprogen and ferric-rhodotorulic acid